MSTVADRVIAIEKQMWTQCDNPATFEKALADDSISVIEPKGIIEKADAVRMAAEAKPFTDVQISDVVVRELTPDCVAVVYHGEGNMEGMPDRYRATISSVYVKKDGDWQLGMTTHQPQEQNGKAKS